MQWCTDRGVVGWGGGRNECSGAQIGGGRVGRRKE